MPNVMPPAEYIGGALCDSTVIPFLVPRRKVWLNGLCSSAAFKAVQDSEKAILSPNSVQNTIQVDP